jgi:hypothetical protein
MVIGNPVFIRGGGRAHPVPGATVGPGLVASTTPSGAISAVTAMLPRPRLHDGNHAEQDVVGCLAARSRARVVADLDATVETSAALELGDAAPTRLEQVLLHGPRVVAGIGQHARVLWAQDEIALSVAVTAQSTHH